MNSMDKNQKNIADLGDFEFVRKQNERYSLMLDKLSIGLLTVKNNSIFQTNNKLRTFLNNELADLQTKTFVDLCSEFQTGGRIVPQTISDAIKLSFSQNVNILDWSLKNQIGSHMYCDLCISSYNVENNTYTQFEIYEKPSSNSAPFQIVRTDADLEVLSEEREGINEELRATLDELVEVNKQLSDSENWNKSIVDNIPLGLIVFIDKQVEYVNDIFANLFGYPADESELLSIIDRAASSYSLSFRLLYDEFKHKNDFAVAEFWVKSTLNKNCYIRNQFVRFSRKRWMIIITDLTNEKNKENELRIIKSKLEEVIITLKESENRFSALVTNSPVVFSAVSSNGVFTLSEGRGLEKLGMKPGQLVGQNVSDAFSNCRQFVDIIENALKGSIQNETFQIGSSVFDTYMSPVFNDKGEVKSAVGVSTDITEKFEAEENLRFSEERFRTIVQHLSDIIIIIDSNYHVKYESPSVGRVFGYEKGVLLGVDFLSIIHSDDLATIQFELKQMLDKSNDFAPVVIRVRHNENQWIYIELIANNLINHPAISGVLLTARDITERKTNEVQLALYQNHLELLVEQRTKEVERINEELVAINEELTSTNEELA
jgi:PAS domain S-box-containing protein